MTARTTDGWAKRNLRKATLESGQCWGYRTPRPPLTETVCLGGSRKTDPLHLKHTRAAAPS